MASPDMTVSIKRHTHPVLGGLSLSALVLSCVALAKACPPVPAPASVPAPVADKPLVVAPVPVPVVAPVVAPPATDVKPAEVAAPVVAPAPESK